MSNIINLNFDDGIKRIVLNGDESRVIRWNPSDINFVDNFTELVYWMENGLQDEISNAKIDGFDASAKASIDEDGNLNVDGYKVGGIKKVGNEINNRLDKVFGLGTAKIAFGESNPASPTPTGNPIFVNFIKALTPIIEDSFKSNDEAMSKYKIQADKMKRQSGDK